MNKYWLMPLPLLSACSTPNLDQVLPDKQVEYKKEVIVDKSLEIPPDLTSSRIQTQVPELHSYQDYQQPQMIAQAAPQKVLPQPPKVRMLRDGEDRWLVFEAPADEVWDKLVQFWQENGILLVQQDPELGLMETDWLENRADIKNDLITDTIRKVFDGLYGAATRDKYRLRLEHGEGNTTELYLTHFGMEQTFVNSTTEDEDQIYWKIRPRDPGLEAIMLRKIMLYFGLDAQEAEQQLAQAKTVDGIQARLLNRGDQLALKINQPFQQAWRIVGLALDRAGFMVEDRDRTAGVYYVHYEDPTQGQGKKSWLQKMAFWQDDEPPPPTSYKVMIQAQGEDSLVQIGDDTGLSKSETAQRILTLIQEHIE